MRASPRVLSFDSLRGVSSFRALLLRHYFTHIGSPRLIRVTVISTERLSSEKLVLVRIDAEPKFLQTDLHCSSRSRMRSTIQGFCSSVHKQVLTLYSLELVTDSVLPSQGNLETTRGKLSLPFLSIPPVTKVHSPSFYSTRRSRDLPSSVLEGEKSVSVIKLFVFLALLRLDRRVDVFLPFYRASTPYSHFLVAFEGSPTRKPTPFTRLNPNRSSERCYLIPVESTRIRKSSTKTSRLFLPLFQISDSFEYRCLTKLRPSALVK